MNPGKTLLLLQFLLCAATAAAQSGSIRCGSRPAPKPSTR